MSFVAPSCLVTSLKNAESGGSFQRQCIALCTADELFPSSMAFCARVALIQMVMRHLMTHGICGLPGIPLSRDTL